MLSYSSFDDELENSNVKSNSTLKYEMKIAHELVNVTLTTSPHFTIMQFSLSNPTTKYYS